MSLHKNLLLFVNKTIKPVYTNMHLFMGDIQGQITGKWARNFTITSKNKGLFKIRSFIAGGNNLFREMINID